MAPIFCLRNVDIYQDIPEDELIRIAKTAVESHIEKGTVLFSPEDPAASVYVIKDGEVELYHLENGKRIVFETLLPGDVFGDFGVGNTDYYAETTRRSYLCQTPTEEFLAIVKAHPSMALNLMKTLAEKVQDYEQKIASLARPAKDQILDELRRLREKNHKSLLGRMFRIPLRISHQRLAEKTGLNRVTVTKLLGELRNEGTLSVNEKTGEMEIEGGRGS